MKINHKGFSVVEVLVIIAVVGVLALAGWYVWKKNQDKHAKNNTPAAAQNQNNAGEQKTPDPYAGWKSAELTYEKLTYKYPAEWKQDVTSTPDGATGTVEPGSDRLTLTGARSNLQVEVRTGLDGVGSAVGQMVTDSVPVTLLGGQYYLNFYTFDDSENSSDVYGACIDASKTQADKFPNKNITRMDGEKALMSICVHYPLVQEEYTRKTVEEFKDDPSFADAKRIVESFTY